MTGLKGEGFFATSPRRMPRAGKPLTKREVRVLVLVAEGLTNDQICRKLGYAPGTVSTMMQRILRKLDVPGRAAAVDRGWRLGYLPIKDL